MELYKEKFVIPIMIICVQVDDSLLTKINCISWIMMYSLGV